MQVEIFKNPSNEHFKSKYSHGVTSIFKNIGNIYTHEGFFALYKGLPATAIGIIHPLVFFPLYEKLKIYFKDNLEAKEA